MPKADYASGASGAVTGAAAGAPLGPLGIAGGAIIGGAAGLFGGGKKKKKKPKIFSTLDPQQESLYKDYVKSLRGKGPLKDLYNFDTEGYNDVFDKTIGKPAYRNFQENIIPGITGQFRSEGLMNSTYAGQSLSRAGRDVQENLDAQRSANIFQGQQNAQNARQSGVENALNRQTFSYGQPEAKTPSTIDQILNKGGPAAAEWFADYLSKGNSGGSPPVRPEGSSTPTVAPKVPLPNFGG